MVERNLAKVEVESSRLFSRSKFEGKHSGFPLILSKQRFAARRDSKMVMQRIANPPIPVRFRVSPPNPARVVKLVDTTDLKSVAWVKPAYRFDSGSGHQINNIQYYTESGRTEDKKEAGNKRLDNDLDCAERNALVRQVRCHSKKRQNNGWRKVSSHDMGRDVHKRSLLATREFQ